jgi:uncharacterized protein YdeI (YjbR/CyaY-like superfamily)
MPEPRFFKTASAWRTWLEKHHGIAAEMSVGFRKKASGLKGITYAEALDEALAFGWIDGVRNSIDKTSYKIRFTPRKKGSIWSTVNTERVAELTRLGRMHPAGLAVFEGRDRKKAKLYSHEQARHGLAKPYEAKLRANAKAWEFYQSQPPSYRKPASWWVMSAKQEETRERRLGTLIEDSAVGRRIVQLTWKPARSDR